MFGLKIDYNLVLYICKSIIDSKDIYIYISDQQCS